MLKAIYVSCIFNVLEADTHIQKHWCSHFQMFKTEHTWKHVYTSLKLIFTQIYHMAYSKLIYTLKSLFTLNPDMWDTLYSKACVQNHMHFWH